MVSSISSISSSSSQVYPDPSIKAILDSLGIQPTGSTAGDMAAIKAALAENSSSSSSENSNNSSSSSSQSNKSGGGPGGEPPWAGLMQELGISLTGTKEGDFAAIQEAISNLESQSQDDADKAKASSYQSQFDNIVKQDSTPAFSTEMNQTASINKALMNINI
jgi:hypothetical protein